MGVTSGAPLLAVTDAQALMRDVRVRQFHERRWTENEKHAPIWPPTPEPITNSPGPHFEDAARGLTGAEPVPVMPDNLKATAARIWTAYNVRAWKRKEEENFRQRSFPSSSGIRPGGATSRKNDQGASHDKRLTVDAMVSAPASSKAEPSS